jgi:mono/diheme cytochrome c family protein
MSSIDSFSFDKLARLIVASDGSAADSDANSERRWDAPDAGIRASLRRRWANGTAVVAAAAALMLLLDGASAQDTSFGQRLFRDKADCQYCHGIDGDGRGSPQSPGRAANLHMTILNREQLIEVIACGRPGTEMPHFDKYAYEETKCYGRSAAELGNDLPRDPHSTSLTRREIEAVVDYILATFVGK